MASTFKWGGTMATKTEPNCVNTFIPIYEVKSVMKTIPEASSEIKTKKNGKVVLVLGPELSYLLSNSQDPSPAFTSTLYIFNDSPISPSSTLESWNRSLLIKITFPFISSLFPNPNGSSTINFITTTITKNRVLRQTTEQCNCTLHGLFSIKEGISKARKGESSGFWW